MPHETKFVNDRVRFADATARVSVRVLRFGFREVLRIERDKNYPAMWRIKLPNGGLSDLVNISRATDAALDLAEAIEHRKTPHKSPLKSLNNFKWSSQPIAAREKTDPGYGEQLSSAPLAGPVEVEARK